MQNQEFISKYLPVLVHLMMCEGLHSVLGDELKSAIIKFEKFKVDELDKYLEEADGSTVKIMSRRLQHLMRFYKQQNQGVLPFEFGKDVYKGMNYQEVIHMPQSMKTQLYVR